MGDVEMEANGDNGNVVKEEVKPEAEVKTEGEPTSQESAEQQVGSFQHRWTL